MTPRPEPPFVRVAAVIGDATRARMLGCLLDGALRTAGELARIADVAPQTASAHLATLVDAGLVTVRAQGRHRYFRLADGDVAHALEALAIVSDRGSSEGPRQRRWSNDALRPLRHARTCYGHLAGELGVALHDRWLQGGLVVRRDDRYALGDDAVARLVAAGFDAAGLSPTARRVYPCVDWSERRDHLAGPLAVAVLDHCIERHWLVRDPASRALAVNDATRERFERFLRGD